MYCIPLRTSQPPQQLPLEKTTDQGDDIQSKTMHFAYHTLNRQQFLAEGHEIFVSFFSNADQTVCLFIPPTKAL